MKIVSFVVGFLSMASLSAQYSEVYHTYKEKYPKAYGVRLHELVHIDVKLEDGQVVIDKSVDYKTLLLTQAALLTSKDALYYSSFSSLEDIKATAYNFEGKKYVPYKVSDFVNSDAQGEAFYNDTQKIEFLYKGLTEGSKTQLSYTRHIDNPRFLDAHYFAAQVPVEYNELVVTVDNAIDMEFRTYALEDLPVIYEEKPSKSKTVYTWKLHQSPAFELESDAPNYQKRLPQIIPMVKSYQFKDEKVEVGGSVSCLFDWYYGLVENVNQQAASEEMKTLVAEITAGKSTDIEKVKAIYYWVQEHIKYIAFEYALGGFIPREANEVFEKKYGDCKDNSSILYQMLELAGLKGYLTWVGTRDIPFTYEELPTPAVDNHMILTYKDGDQSYFLDATGRYTTLEQTTSFIQGKEVLIGLEKGKFQVEKVPVYPSTANKVTDSVYVQFKDKQLFGKGYFEAKGYPKTDLFAVLEQISKEERLKKFYAKQFQKGSNRCVLETFEEQNKFSYEAPFGLIYTFNIQDYLKTYQDEVYVNLNLFPNFSNYKIAKDRKAGRRYNYQTQGVFKAVLEIPEAYDLKYLPKNYEYRSAVFDASITYQKLSDRKVLYELHYDQKFIELNFEQQQQLDAEVKKLEKQYKDVIVLKNHTS